MGERSGSRRKRKRKSEQDRENNARKLAEKKGLTVVK